MRVGVPRQRLRSAASALLLLLQGHVAEAVHPAPPREPALLARIERSDAIAVARVVGVDAGRLHLHEGRALLGAVPSEFRIKRSPLDPPPYLPGDQAIFFLRGARSPYVFVEKPREMIRLPDQASLARLVHAVEALIAHREDASQLLSLHLGWLREPDEGIRRLAWLGLTDPGAPFAPLPANFAIERARVASDASRPLVERRAAARLAARELAGLEQLLDWVPGDDLAADEEIVRVTLRAAAQRDDVSATNALLRSLRHPRAEIQTVAIGTVGAWRTEPGAAVRAELERLADVDSAPDVQRQAQAALRRFGEPKGTPSPGSRTPGS